MDRDTIIFGISIFGFLIRGKGRMEGKKFADIIRSHCSNLKAKIIAEEIETHIKSINVNYKGTKVDYVQ